MPTSSLLFFSLLVCGTHSLCPQPYPPLSGGSFTGKAQPYSPDPLVTYTYGPSTNVSQLQVFITTPQTCTLTPGTPASSFTSWETLTTSTPKVEVSGAGGLVLDFAVELPAWVEIDSPDISPDDLKSLILGTSEFNEVDIIGTTYKQGVPQECGAPGTYRLVTNKQLYEGVRYAFITMKTPPTKPFTITGFRAVVQSKPVNYTGEFSGDERTTKIWYAAAYTVRTNLEPDYMGAILEDRGDRYSWAGDAHVSQISSLVAFGNTWDVAQNLVGTGKSQNGIASYSLYFCDSVMDFYAFTHDPSTLTLYYSEVNRILTTAYSNINTTTKMTFFGWDDRLGSGFQNASTTESQWAYKLILVKLLARWGATQTAAGNATVGAQFAALADAAWASVSAQLTAVATPLGVPWWGPLGVHAAAEALSTLRLGGGDVAAIISGRFNDTGSLCSLSNFNQYWILLGLAAGGALDRGLASVSLCWGPELDMGGTTFWEISSPDWAAFTPAGDPIPNGENGYTSLCHPWSSGPTAWLSMNALGVHALLPASPHGRAFIAPHVSQIMVQEACDAVPSSSSSSSSISSVLSGAVPLGGGEGGSVVVRVSVALGGPISITLPSTFSPAASSSPPKATLVLSEALLLRLGLLQDGEEGGGNCTTTTVSSSCSPATLPVTAHITTTSSSALSSASSSSFHSLTWVSRGHASLPPGYTPPLLEMEEGGIVGGGTVREGRAAMVVLEGGVSKGGMELETYTFTVSFPSSSSSSSLSSSSTGTHNSCACLKLKQRAGGSGVSPPLVVPPHPFPPPTYPAQFQGLDGLTRGNWVGTYGGDGGVLFGGGSTGDNTPRTFLPPYIQAVTPTFSFLQGIWEDATNTSDTRAPQTPPPASSSPPLRTAGYLADSMGGDPTYAVDIPFTASTTSSSSSSSSYSPPSTFLMAVYAVDWDTRGRRETLALLDLETLNPISPIQGLKDFTEGVWVVWRLFTNATTSGVRLRVSQTRGDNAVVSAILFSSQ